MSKCLFEKQISSREKWYRQQRQRMDSQGNRVDFSSVSEYLLQVGLESYLKQFLTFKWTAEFYPEQIKLMSYENLVLNPEKHFKEIVYFLGDYLVENHKEHYFYEALKYSDKNFMQKFENKLGRALGNDQTDSQSRHIRSGAIGQWKNHLNSEDLESVEAVLRKFKLSLHDFVLDAKKWKFKG